MVVLLLIAIMTAMVVPAMRGTYEDALLRSTARKLVDVFNLANSRAVTLNQTYQVSLDKRNGRYAVHCERRTADTTPLEGTFDSRITLEIREADADPAEQPQVEEAEAPPRSGEVIAFYADGTADNREVLLRDREGFRLALRINPTTARVHIVEQGRE